MNKLENAVIKYQIDFERYKNGQANDVINLLDKACKDISVYLKKTTGVYTKARYQELVKKIKSISKSLKENVDSNIAIDDVINYELKKEKKLLKVAENYIKKSNSAKIDFLYPALEQIKTAALFKPIDTKYGMTYQSYLDGIENGLFNVWDSAIRTGYLTGQTTQQIVHSVIGGVSAKSRLVTQGAINSLRNSVYSNTRTVLQSFANETRNRVYEENEKYFGSKDDYKYEYLSTLDSRTCLVCGELSGKLFKSVKEFPQLPLHRGCRCMIIPYFNIENDVQASKDGYIDSDVTFEKWLNEQDDKIQKDILGKTRYNLYKNGEKIKDFVDNGNVITIKQLNEKLDIKINTINIYDEIKSRNIKAIPFQKTEKIISENELIEKLSVKDNENGACASLSFAYIANKAGYNVVDNRGGDSELLFRNRFILEKIATLKGVKSKIIKSNNTLDAAKNLLKYINVGKEYNLIVARHSAIVRKNESGILTFLELQNKSVQGFLLLNERMLKSRFDCKENDVLLTNILIDTESLFENKQFLDIMKYINTKK